MSAHSSRLESQNASQPTVIVASRRSWFARGFFGAVLLAGATNAASYFVRSDGLGDLAGVHPERLEALGFPWIIWARGLPNMGAFVDYGALYGNVFAALAFALLAGAFTAFGTRPLNRLAEPLEQKLRDSEQEQSVNVQFSIRSLLVAMVVAAMIAGLWRSAVAGRPETLIAIYILGPLVLVGVAMAPRNIPWQQRVVILVPLTLLLIGAAIGIGGRLPSPREFDQVLLGIFICWTPQCVLGALAVTLATFAFEAYLLRFGDPPPPAEETSQYGA